MTGVAAVLEDPWNTKGTRVVELLETLVVDVFNRGGIAIRIYGDVFCILIDFFDFLHHFRVDLGLNDMRWGISAIW